MNKEILIVGGIVAGVGLYAVSVMAAPEAEKAGTSSNVFSQLIERIQAIPQVFESSIERIQAIPQVFESSIDTFREFTELPGEMLEAVTGGVGDVIEGGTSALPWFPWFLKPGDIRAKTEEVAGDVEETARTIFGIPGDIFAAGMEESGKFLVEGIGGAIVGGLQLLSPVRFIPQGQSVTWPGGGRTHYPAPLADTLSNVIGTAQFNLGMNPGGVGLTPKQVETIAFGSSSPAPAPAIAFGSSSPAPAPAKPSIRTVWASPAVRPPRATQAPLPTTIREDPFASYTRLFK